MLEPLLDLLRRWRAPLMLGLLAVGAVHLVRAQHPLRTVETGQVGVRINRATGEIESFAPGPVWVIPGVHELKLYSLRDQVFRPEGSSTANGAGAFQSIEGLSIGVDVSVRYALDHDHVVAMARRLPEDVGGQIVGPAAEGVIYKTFTRYTVKEIFSTRRGEIHDAIEKELQPLLAKDGVILRAVQVGKVDLPADYRAGMEQMLAEEMASEKMSYTLKLKDQEVKQSALEAEAEKVRREKAAEAAASEQVIAAKAQEETMKHLLPFKQKQIQQRKLEAEADKLSRVKGAEANAEARRIEAAGEADSRQKLADAEVYRLDHVGRIASEQMERDGAALSKHPLLIQKAMADKLSDKVQVIIAPPAAGGFIAANLLGQSKSAANAASSGGEGD